jgi:hypothetical protein
MDRGDVLKTLSMPPLGPVKKDVVISDLRFVRISKGKREEQRGGRRGKDDALTSAKIRGREYS